MIARTPLRVLICTDTPCSTRDEGRAITKGAGSTAHRYPLFVFGHRLPHENLSSNISLIGLPDQILHQIFSNDMMILEFWIALTIAQECFAP